MQLRIRSEAEKRLMGNDDLIQNVPDYLDEFTLTAHIARDIECQWEIFLINTYSLKELGIMDFSKVELPLEWFIE